MKKHKLSSKWVWGTFLLLVAAFILSNQFGGFLELGFWSLAIGALAVIFTIQCIVNLSIPPLPIPIATLYYILQTPLNFPYIKFWPLTLVTFLVMCGLYAMMPNKYWRGSRIRYGFGDGKRGHKDEEKDSSGVHIVEGDDPNNPYINVEFGTACRYLHADCMETAELSCRFGSLEVYFDNVELSPDGAEATIKCNIGNIDMYLPRSWRVVDRMSVSLANLDVDGKHIKDDEEAPTLTIKGGVSLGNISIHRIG